MTADPFRTSLSRRAVLGAGAALTLALALPGGAAARQTPPEDDAMDVQDRLERLLAAVPVDDVDTDAPIPFYYADLAGQLGAAGVERPNPAGPTTALPPGFVEATMALPLAARAFESGRSEEWLATFGFNPYAVDQALTLAEPPHVVSFFRGGFSRERVEAALEASGYQVILQETGGSYYSFGDDISPETPIGRLGLGAMNQAMVTDDLLVFAHDEGDLQAVTQVVGDYQPSLLEEPGWAEVAPRFPADTVGLIPISPELVAGLPVEVATPMATPVGAGAGLERIVFGVRAGSRSEPLALVGDGTPAATPVGEPGVPARVEARLWYGSAELAEREAEAIPARWREGASALTGQPWPELMALDAATVMADTPEVVALSFTAPVPNRWVQLIHTRDLAPLAPATG